MAEYEHQFKAIDEAQKIFVVREMVPRDIKREFLTGPRTFDEIMEKLEIIVDEMMADDGPVPMDLGNVGAHDTKMAQNDSDTSNDISYEDVCAIAWRKDTGQAREQARRDRMDQEHGIVGKELMSGRAARAPMEASPTCTATRTKGTREKARARAKARVKADEGRVSQKERMLKNSRAWKRMTRKEWCWPKKGRVTVWGRRMGSQPAVRYLTEEDEEGEQASGGLNHLVSRNTEEPSARGRRSPWWSTREQQRM